MKAQILYGIGNIKYTEVEKPRAEAGEALVKVRRCGICGSDIPRIYKTGAHNMPLIPGHEFTGIVESCGAEPELLGRRVGIFPLIPCMKCDQCRSGHYEMCYNYNYLGSRCDGGYAEYVSVPVWNLLPLPDEVTDDEAAMLEPMCVAIHAAKRAGLINVAGKSAADTSIAICGLGTIGLLLAMFLKDAGYSNIFFMGNKDIQKKKLLDMGYNREQICDVRYGDPRNFIMQKTGGTGTDIYFECVGRPESYAQAVSCAAPLGKVVLVGNPAADMELSREAYWKILRNQLTLTGTWNSSYRHSIKKENKENSDDWNYALHRLKAWHEAERETAVGRFIEDDLGNKVFKKFFPDMLITHRFVLENMQDGLRIMQKKSEEYIKIMIEI